MLRTNLATRPFYNERAVHTVLLLVGITALVVLVAGGLRLRALTIAHATLVARAERDETMAAEIRAATAAVQQATTTQHMDALAAAARDANRLIERRVFSWTECFNLIEGTLPDDVMLTSVRPGTDGESLQLVLGIVGRDQAAIASFVERLEQTGAFAGVLVRDEEFVDNGSYRAVVDGRYLEPRGDSALPTSGQSQEAIP